MRGVYGNDRSGSFHFDLVDHGLDKIITSRLSRREHARAKIGEADITELQGAANDVLMKQNM